MKGRLYFYFRGFQSWTLDSQREAMTSDANDATPSEPLLSSQHDDDDEDFDPL